MANEERRFGAFMDTESGRRIYFEDPRPEDFVPRDVAYSLALQCRFAGYLPPLGRAGDDLRPSRPQAIA